MEREKVPVAEKIISLSDSDASFIVKGGWNTVVGYRPQLARSVCESFRIDNRDSWRLRLSSRF
jgi:hypothetical protein